MLICHVSLPSLEIQRHKIQSHQHLVQVLAKTRIIIQMSLSILFRQYLKGGRIISAVHNNYSNTPNYRMIGKKRKCIASSDDVDLEILCQLKGLDKPQNVVDEKDLYSY